MKYLVTMSVEITRVVDADSKEDALEKVDSSDMIHELKNYSVNAEWSAKEL